ncbi:ABC transporter family protein [Trichomonas vaginalis G3]|uniref:ABC transporter family protein n=1 Tax=Trichomonas vaginalis (strain ATCC PRA-98 / G3) TaxID=412133 RepID=A2F5D6_TRIV3|nr:ATPase activity, coupled to transmembrane movement of substances [Trichomonas vaginalis G3]EAX99899.1 ABC transporter family protein [Trichomonas vaginalis G3]KAI5492921.1 ATPase activity, coupled to transmembrane movement of substances [Trichomonas vaginalis G3]|eukprot:XP_001312829.1 ABC transporter family protein [Trichomonas vaginalis G3]
MIPTPSEAIAKKTENGHYEIFDGWSSSSTLWDFQSYYRFYRINSSFYLNSPLTRQLANYSNTSKIFDDESAFQEYSKTPNTFMIRVDEKPEYNYNISSKIEIRRGAGFQANTIKDLSDSILKELINLLSDIDRKYYPNKMKTFERTQFTYVFIEWLICFGLTIAFIIPMFEIAEARETRQLLLLKISGAYETTIFLANLTIDSFIILLNSILVTIVLHRQSCEGSNGFLIFCFVLPLVIYYYVFFLNAIPLAIMTKYKVIFTGIFIILSLLPNLNFTMTGDDSDFLKYSLILMILPQWLSTMFIDNIMVSKVFNYPFTLKNITLLFRWKNSWVILGITFGFICAYLLLYCFLNIMMPRKSGSPPVGFSNIFSSTAWKQLFSFRRSDLIEVEGENFIKVLGIDKTYKGSTPVHALKNVSFSIDKGDVTVLIGPNGSGKSTLLNSMTGSISSDKGILRIYGRECVSGFSALQQHLGICYQENILFDRLSVYRHLEFFATIRGVDKSKLKEVIDHSLSSFQLDGLDNMKAGTLSGGQKRKLCVAIAFIGNPLLVILDEPTAGMDASVRQEIWKAISGYNVTSIVSTHSIEEAGILSSRMFVMRNGELIFDGTPNELRSKFHCGYRLTPMFNTEEDKKYRTELLSWMKTKIEDVVISPIHDDDLLFPVCDKVTNAIVELQHKKEDFHMRSFNIIVEQLENVLYRMYPMMKTYNIKSSLF